MRKLILTLCLMLAPIVLASQAYANSYFIVISEMGMIPKQLAVSKGENIQLVVNNKDDVVRNLSVPQFNVKTPFLMQGEMATISFQAKEEGIISLYSYSPGESQPITGTIIIQ